MIAVGLTVLYVGVMLRLALYRKRYGVFDTNLDLVNPAHYKRGARRLIGLAIITALAAVGAWLIVFRSA